MVVKTKPIQSQNSDQQLSVFLKYIEKKGSTQTANFKLLKDVKQYFQDLQALDQMVQSYDQEFIALGASLHFLEFTIPKHYSKTKDNDSEVHIHFVISLPKTSRLDLNFDLKKNFQSLTQPARKAKQKKTVINYDTKELDVSFNIADSPTNSNNSLCLKPPISQFKSPGQFLKSLRQDPKLKIEGAQDSQQDKAIQCELLIDRVQERYKGRSRTHPPVRI